MDLIIPIICFGIAYAVFGMCISFLYTDNETTDIDFITIWVFWPIFVVRTVFRAVWALLKNLKLLLIGN